MCIIPITMWVSLELNMIPHNNFIYSPNVFTDQFLGINLQGPHHGAGEEWWNQQEHEPSTHSAEKTCCKNSACFPLSHCLLSFAQCALISSVLFLTINKEHAWLPLLNSVWCLPNHIQWCISESWWPIRKWAKFSNNYLNSLNTKTLPTHLNHLSFLLPLVFTLLLWTSLVI